MSPPPKKRSLTKSKKFKRSVIKTPNRPVILSEGDSWFDYPLHKNTVDYIERMGSFSMLRVENNGDELLAILSGKQKGKIRKLLRKYPFELILFSGGGNDIVGEDLLSLLNKKKPSYSWEQCINKKRALRRIKQLEGAYLDLIYLRDDNRPNCTIMVHGYDYPLPSESGVKIGPFKVIGPWMKPAMEEKKIFDQRDQNAIARWLIESFNETLHTIARKNKNFIVIETPGTLNSKEWVDEIHPTSRGFQKIAEKFRPELIRLFPGKVKRAR